MMTLYQKWRKNPRQLSSSEVETLINLYDANIRHIDDTIGLVLDNLGGDLVNTIVIVTADHGEVFGEHDCFGHGFLYEELIHVPLIIAGPGIGLNCSGLRYPCLRLRIPSVLGLQGTVQRNRLLSGTP